MSCEKCETNDGIPISSEGEVLIVVDGTTHRFPPDSYGVIFLDGAGKARVVENLQINLDQLVAYERTSTGQIAKSESGAPMESVPPVWDYLHIGSAKIIRGKERIAWKRVRGPSGAKGAILWNGASFEFSDTLYVDGVSSPDKSLEKVGTIVLCGPKPMDAAQRAANANGDVIRKLALLSGRSGILKVRLIEGELVASPVIGPTESPAAGQAWALTWQDGDAVWRQVTLP